ncbi:sugar phosphate isomerase/epimerase family protein [Mucilaginibacter sp. FT3.2]|uniref:sugar phosphate isomerase/epimerase family protein n=1 Tax=Mucilaginibacter sp. FT3.2 TaxID=2723090 RepID=UPI00160D2B6F|nr:TIM barrel protein [Mucilaginibacter sp. FT3.2]MBB6229772.1 sugar phosphate isomerase/epimerase [Mucilaginibacter sp. FT3.2]
MKLKFFCPYWGMRHLSLYTALAQIKAAGYDGVELAIDPDTDVYNQAVPLCTKYNLLLIAQHPYGKGNTVSEHLQDYSRKLEMIMALKPVMVNCHTGRDYYNIAQNLQFLKAAAQLSEKYQVPVAHETHRGRFSFCTTATNRYLKAFPQLALTADFSHWCVVSESLLTEQKKLMNKVIPHCVHLHARVGYAQGPQVPNPAAPAYSQELKAHMKWWKQMVKQHIKNGKDQLTITCEFGPPPYLPPGSYTRDAAVTQWELNLFMKNYLTKNLLK